MRVGDKQHAISMLGMARKDLKALRGMLDTEQFDDEIFGFHAQQTFEKGLKAWLSLIGVEYPKSHDISSLTYLLEQEGCDSERFQDLEDFTVFAVQYRYEAYDFGDAGLQRPDVIDKASTLLQHVQNLIDNAP